MNKAELQEAKNLLQRLKNEVFVAEHSHEEQRDAIEKLLEALPDEENHLQRAELLTEPTLELLEQIDIHLWKLKGVRLSYEDAKRLSEINYRIEQKYYSIADKVADYLRIADENGYK